MSIKIRLAQTGKKNAPAFKIVAAQTRTKRNGKFLDILGDFNPTISGKPTIDKVRLDVWVQKGALLTEPIKRMMEGTYKYTKYNPKAEKTEKEGEQSSNDGVKGGNTRHSNGVTEEK